MKKLLFISLTSIVIFIFIAILIFRNKNLSQEKTLEYGLGAVRSGQNLKNQFCKDNISKVEVSFLEARGIVQKDNCGLGLYGKYLVAISENYLCNEDTGTWSVDLLIKPEKKGCNPSCVVDIVTKTAEINWRCTGISS